MGGKSYAGYSTGECFWGVAMSFFSADWRGFAWKVPSIYPIAFAALLSKSLGTWALDLAQRGTTLGTLHQVRIWVPLRWAGRFTDTWYFSCLPPQRSGGCSSPSMMCRA